MGVLACLLPVRPCGDGGGARGRARRRCARRWPPVRRRARHHQPQPAGRRRRARRPAARSPGPAPPHPPGGPHAEVRALAAAGRRARGGTAVVTLEPCRHTGRTGPCTAALLAAGVARVVRGLRRPDGRRRRRCRRAARGGRRRRHRAAGRRGRRRPAGGLADRAAHRPAVRHLEVRRDAGRPLGRRGRHQPLDHRRPRPAPTCTGCGPRPTPSLVGVGTVLADDPALTVRPDPGRQPLRVVAGPHRPHPAGPPGSTRRWSSPTAPAGRSPRSAAAAS